LADFVSWDGVMMPSREIDIWSWIIPRMQRHPEERIKGYPSYQLNKYNICKNYIKSYDHGVDVGAHCGFWTMAMSQDFQRVTAFEPVGENCRAFAHNVSLVAGACKVDLIQMALGDTVGRVSMDLKETSSANAEVIDGDDIVMWRLDDLNLDPFSFLKIDVDGYELHVIRGALETIKKYKPTIIVEMKAGWGERYGLFGDGPLVLLRSIGYKVQEDLREDFILTYQ
jgi:FkbM family methyltransferase